MIRTAICDEVAFDLHSGGHRLWAKAILPSGKELADAPASLVFLHEGLGSISQWRDFPMALVQATGLPALVYDRYGHGKSEALRGPRAASYLEKEAQACLPELLSACGIAAPILIGHSDGASIALLFAAAFPSVPLAIVSEAAHVFVEDISIQGIWRTLHTFETTPLRAQLARHHGDKVDSMFRGWSDIWLSPAYHDWTMVDQLPRITAPVLAIQGQEDEYGTKAQVQTIVDQVSGPSEACLIPDCGHVPHHQARDRVLAKIQAFLRAHLPLAPEKI